MGFFSTNVLQADALYIVHVQWTEWYHWGGGGGLVSNDYNYLFTIRKFALYVSYAQINQPFIKIIFYIIQMYTTRV